MTSEILLVFRIIVIFFFLIFKVYFKRIEIYKVKYLNKLFFFFSGFILSELKYVK